MAVELFHPTRDAELERLAIALYAEERVQPDEPTAHDARRWWRAAGSEARDRCRARAEAMRRLVKALGTEAREPKRVGRAQ